MLEFDTDFIPSASDYFHKPLPPADFGKPQTPPVEEILGTNEPNSAITAGTEDIGASDWDNQKFNAEQAQIYRDWSASEAQKQRDFNASEARLAREWQEKMSNTSFQRARADLVKAGLNPYLAYGVGGASSPSGATASSGIASGASASYSGVNSASARSLLNAETVLTIMKTVHEVYSTLATAKDVLLNWKFD